MTQYITKDALVAMIKRRKELVSDPILSGNDLMIGERNAYFNLLSFIDTLEVKEVDLEKEIDRFYGMYRKDGKTFLLEDNEECVDWKIDCNPEFEKSFAKHFFELGLKAQKLEEPVSEDLEEAALLHLSKHYDTSIIWEEDNKCVVRDYKAGANWQKEQLMAKAIDGEVGYWNLHGLSVNVKLPHSVEEGDKVKVIVIKED